MGSVGKVNATQKNIVTLRGKEVQLPEALIYGDKVEVSDRLKEFEDKRRDAKIEFALITKDGWAVRKELRGGSGSVRIPVSMLEDSEEFSHIHPRTGDEAGILGGTFSLGDLTSFTSYYPNPRMYRAVAQEGTYTIQGDGRNFSPSQLISAYESYVSQVVKEESKKVSALKVTNFNTYDEYSDAFDAIQNRKLIKLHNWLLQNQTKYGYKYGLEEV